MKDLTEQWAQRQFPGGEDPVLIRRSRDPNGWMGNMTTYPVCWDGIAYNHTEGMFQGLRLPLDLRREVARIPRAWDAKQWARAREEHFIVEPLSEQDLDNMRLCLRLKLEQHPRLEEWLRQTGDRRIIEDCTKRQRGTGLFWGAAERSPGVWHGQNWLGRLWEEQRARLLEEDRFFDTLIGQEGPRHDD